jgi:CCR4-NOT transcription complex subunit 4
MRRYEYFGQYGKIQKIMVKNKEGCNSMSDRLGDESSSSTKSLLSFAAHITFSTPEEASLAILALDKHVFDSRKIRASFGRTKFCKFFLQNTECPERASCPYLHKDCKE